MNRYNICIVCFPAGRFIIITKPDLTIEVEKSYYHLDHLNSTKCVTDETGVLVVMYEYRAFGEQLKRLDADDVDDTDDAAKYSYGGKELDDGTNLYYFNARYYDATIGRFINVDLVQDGSNWYVYCNNNPLCFIDPTGLMDDEIEPEPQSGSSIKVDDPTPTVAPEPTISSTLSPEELYNTPDPNSKPAPGTQIEYSTELELFKTKNYDELIKIYKTEQQMLERVNEHINNAENCIDFLKPTAKVLNDLNWTLGFTSFTSASISVAGVFISSGVVMVNFMKISNPIGTAATIIGFAGVSTAAAEVNDRLQSYSNTLNELEKFQSYLSGRISTTE